MKDILSNKEIPIGLSMAFAQNLDALEQFSSMEKSEKERVINGTHGIQSKEEMQRYVSNISKGNSFS